MRHALSSPLLTTCLAGAVALGVGGCDASDREQVDEPTPAGVSPVAQVDIEDLQDDPAAFHGREVRVLGEIDDPSYGDRAFVLEADEWVFVDEVLVLSETPMQLGGRNLADGDDVIVVGTVWYGDLPGLEREIGWMIGEEMADDWDDKAIIVARSVEPIHAID